MRWNRADKVPNMCSTLVLLCEDGTILFYGEHDGENYVVWSDDIEIWIPTEKPIIGWMYQAEVRKHLALLPFVE